MSKFTKFLFAFTGLAGIVLLTYALFVRTPATPINYEAVPHPPEEEIELFLNDRMDYGLQFSALLVEKRIARASDIGRSNPRLAERAVLVADSLRARLQRKAKL